MKKIKEHPYYLTFSIVSLLIGLWVYFDEPARVMTFVHAFLGCSLLLSGFSKVSNNQNKNISDGVLSMVIGGLLLMFNQWIITLVLGVIFIITPLVKIIKSKGDKKVLKYEVPMLVIGLAIALSGDVLTFIFVKALAVAFVLLGLYLFVCIFVEKISFVNVYFPQPQQSQQTPKRKNVINVEYEERDSNEKR